jgi:hypothetical protein
MKLIREDVGFNVQVCSPFAAKAMATDYKQ